MRKVLLVAYHFPPIRVSSGLQRTLSLARYLRYNGWEPLVLSISPLAYEVVSDDQLRDIPPGTIVKRAFGLDTARHLSIRGRYPGILAVPDRWVSWFPSALLCGLKMIRRDKVDLIWSTYPIATAHRIGYHLQKITGLPWIADFRDSMTEDNYPPDRRQWKSYRSIETRAVQNASRVVLTTSGTLDMYRARYPNEDRAKFSVIPNGYDEDIFSRAEATMPKQSKSADGPVRLVHSGILYPSERDPTQFFDAVAQLKRTGKITAKKVQIILRATGSDQIYGPMLESREINDIVQLEAGVNYREALQEMLSVDGLLLFQASNCNHQVPAKLYEYFRAQKPIFAMTDPAGNTAQCLAESGIKNVAKLDNLQEIAAGLLSFIDAIDGSNYSVADINTTNKYSRRALVKRYSALFDAAAR